MSSYLILTIIIGAVWLAIGAVLSIVMGRRGHLSVGWGALGAMLGPLAVLAALATARHEKDEHPSTIAPPAPLGGPVDVLVGIDGSVECRLALERVIALFGPRLGRLCLATVVPFEDVPAHRQKAIADLRRHARLSGIPGAGQELLCGPPAAALVDFAQAGGYQLLVVGGRGKGLSKALIGSTATALACACPVPTLIVSAGPRAESVAA
jgi:nucleotide-binding universal stress UspA family protein